MPSSPSARRRSGSTRTIPGRIDGPGRRVAVVTEDPAEAHRSARSRGARPSRSTCARARAACPRATERRPAPAPPAPRRSAAGDPLRPVHVFAALACACRVTPSCSRRPRRAKPELHRAPPGGAPARRLEPGDGRARRCDPRRDRAPHGAARAPDLAIVGDGSSLDAIQSLWSAAHYGVGALFVSSPTAATRQWIRLAEQSGGVAPGGRGFRSLDVAGLARAFGCPGSQVVSDHGRSAATSFDDVLTRPRRLGTSLLLLEVAVAPDEELRPVTVSRFPG